MITKVNMKGFRDDKRENFRQAEDLVQLGYRLNGSQAGLRKLHERNYWKGYILVFFIIVWYLLTKPSNYLIRPSLCLHGHRGYVWEIVKVLFPLVGRIGMGQEVTENHGIDWYHLHRRGIEVR